MAPSMEPVAAQMRIPSPARPPVTTQLGSPASFSAPPALRPWYTSSAASVPPLPAPAPIRDAEVSVDFLCRKFEELSEQLRQEEVAREAAQRRGKLLASELESSEEAAARRRSLALTEHAANQSCLAAMRVAAGESKRRATLQADRVQDEEALGARTEQRCLRLTEECRLEAARCDQVTAQFPFQDRENMQEQCENAEIGRRLRLVEADTRASLEDLRIAQQRALLVRNEQQAFKQDLEAANQACRASLQEGEGYSQKLPDQRQQRREAESKLEGIVEALEAARADGLRADKHLSILREEDRNTESRIGSLRQELAVAEREAHATDAELHSRVEASASLIEELQYFERRRASDTQEVKLHRHALAEAECAVDAARKGTGHMHIAKESLCRQLDELSSEDQHNLATMGGLRRTRHAEDLAFEDVQTELQAAYHRRETLTEDLAKNVKARDTLMVQLRRVRPEMSEADERCTVLESRLAQGARELEEELVQQRHTQQELSVASEALRDLQHHEARLEANAYAAANVSSLRDLFAKTTIGAPRYGPGSRAGSRSGSRCGSPAPGTASRAPPRHRGNTQSPSPARPRAPPGSGTRNQQRDTPLRSGQGLRLGTAMPRSGSLSAVAVGY